MKSGLVSSFSVFRGIGALRRGERGVALIEFALVLPVLILLFIGLVEFSEAFTVSRKLATTANTVSDLVAQEATVTTGDLDNIALVADEIMKPYSTTPLTLVIVSVVADSTNTPRVDWSYPATYATGAVYALPQADMTEPGSSLIIAEATYGFTPTVSRFLGTFNINKRALFRPRIAPSVSLN